MYQRKRAPTIFECAIYNPTVVLFLLRNEILFSAWNFRFWTLVVKQTSKDTQTCSEQASRMLRQSWGSLRREVEHTHAHIHARAHTYKRTSTRTYSSTHTYTYTTYTYMHKFTLFDANICFPKNEGRDHVFWKVKNGILTNLWHS